MMAEIDRSSSHALPETNAFTRDLDALSRKHGLVLVGARVAPIDLTWEGPDAEKWAQYAVGPDGALARGFWDDV